MADRKAELERKKSKLEQMRRERTEKERIKKTKEVRRHRHLDDKIKCQKSR